MSLRKSASRSSTNMPLKVSVVWPSEVTRVIAAQPIRVTTVSMAAIQRWVAPKIRSTRSTRKDISRRKISGAAGYRSGITKLFSIASLVLPAREAEFQARRARAAGGCKGSSQFTHRNMLEQVVHRGVHHFGEREGVEAHGQDADCESPE